MAEIHELIDRVEEPELREQLRAAVDQLAKQKKFGLVFEEHLPECVPLYEVPVKKGCLVSRKQEEAKDIFVVLSVKDGEARCLPKNGGEAVTLPIDALVTVAEFGEPIYPYLRPMDTVCNAPDSDLWHTLIEADNYHALQLLEYLYSGQVDCIYIDPPYNTGTDDWKYNDAFVDSSDHWAHSKWLSMIKKRLKIASRILKSDGVLVVSIGYQELHHLVLLLEELFKDRQIVTVTVQTSTGKPSGGFNFLQEYLIFVTPYDFSPLPTSFAGGKANKAYHAMTLASFTQTQRPNQVYPIYVDAQTGKIKGHGLSLQQRVKKGLYIGELSDFIYDYSEAPQGTVAVWPVSRKGEPCVWRLSPSRFERDLNCGYINVIRTGSNGAFNIQFLADGVIKKVEQGEAVILGRDTVNGALIINDIQSKGAGIPTIWTEKMFYTSKGTSQIQDVFGSKEFPYPKPLDLITEILHACTKKDSLILDFYAGSGTTLQATNLLNDDDGGHRRCIIVTNNEVSKAQDRVLRKRGLSPWDAEWEKEGICKAVTWPRTKCTIIGKRYDGTPIPGEYPVSQDGEQRLAADGLAANVAYFKLGFLDKTSVALGQQFQKMLPTLWMKAGAKGACPVLTDEQIPPLLVLPENGFAVLNDQSAFEQFAAAVNANDAIQTVYIVTDYVSGYQAMARQLKAERTYQLYRDYLENFRINTGRDSR